MTIAADPPVTAIAAAVERLRAAQDEVAALLDPRRGEVWSLGSDELLETTVALHQSACRSDAAMHALVREVDVRGAAVSAGATHTAAWLKARLHLHHGHAKRVLATARGLHDDRSGRLVPDFDHIPDVDASGEDNGGASGTDGGATPDGLRMLREAFAEGSVSGEQVSVVTRTLSKLPPVDSQTYAAAELFLAEQAPLRDPSQLARLGRRLRHVLDPDTGEKLSKEEAERVVARSLEIRVGDDGSSTLKGKLDAELTALLLSRLEPLAAPRPAVDGIPDSRPVAQRRADALYEILQLAGSAPTGPTRHGTRPTITVTIGLDDLKRDLGSAGGLLDWSGPISAEAARRLACDARIIPVVLGAKGEPLDVGRASYSVSQAIWRGLVARDRGCAFAGCDRPPEWTEAHHNEKHWADGGVTSVETMCLLCDHHHRSVHHHGWRLVLRDGQMWTIPPPWVDPTQTPRRNTGRHLLDDIDLFRTRLDEGTDS